MSKGREGIQGNARMGAKHKNETVAQSPREFDPIKITFDQMVAMMLIDHGKQDHELSDDLRSARLDFIGDIQQRICDVAIACGFDAYKTYEHLRLDFRIILDLFACKFPGAFRFQLDGTPKKPRKNGGRNVRNKMELVDFVDRLKRTGLTETQACDHYARSKNDQPTVQSLITAYHEAKRWLANKDSWTSFERIEVLEYCYMRLLFG